MRLRMHMVVIHQYMVNDTNAIALVSSWYRFVQNFNVGVRDCVYQTIRDIKLSLKRFSLLSHTHFPLSQYCILRWTREKYKHDFHWRIANISPSNRQYIPIIDCFANMRQCFVIHKRCCDSNVIYISYSSKNKEFHFGNGLIFMFLLSLTYAIKTIWFFHVTIIIHL